MAEYHLRAGLSSEAQSIVALQLFLVIRTEMTHKIEGFHQKCATPCWLSTSWIGCSAYPSGERRFRPTKGKGKGNTKGNAGGLYFGRSFKDLFSRVLHLAADDASSTQSHFPSNSSRSFETSSRWTIMTKVSLHNATSHGKVL
jgi:hypothetical protein